MFKELQKSGYVIRIKKKKGKDLFVKFGINHKTILKTKNPFEKCYYMGKGAKKACVFEKDMAEYIIKDIIDQFPDEKIEVVSTNDVSLNIKKSW